MTLMGKHHKFRTNGSRKNIHIELMHIYRVCAAYSSIKLLTDGSRKNIHIEV